MAGCKTISGQLWMLNKILRIADWAPYALSTDIGTLDGGIACINGLLSLEQEQR
jgi:hypothetical protein